MNTSLTITGCDEIATALVKFPDDLRIKYGERALRDSANQLVAPKIQSLTPKSTGLAAASIGANPLRRYPSSGTLFIATQPRKGFRRVVVPTVRAGVAEIGTFLSKKQSAGFAGGAASRVQDPRKYFRFIQKGRQAVTPIKAAALHSALTGQFFMHAKKAEGHPVFEEAYDAIARPAQIYVENELNRGVAELSRSMLGGTEQA
jgi:hypothetical protein